LNNVITAFPTLWIANGGEDTISKLDVSDTTPGNEVARYRTWFGPAGQPGHQSHLGNPFVGPAPSRTAVDSQGNVYALNRHFDNRPALLVKILTSGGIDRNGNSVIDTSSDANNDGIISGAEILPMADSNLNGILDESEITDERIAWAKPVGPNNGLGRSCSIDPDGNIWVGLFNSQAYYKVSGSTGAILAGPIATPGHSPYGSLVDANRILWGAGIGNTLLKLDTVTHAVTLYTHSGNNYGIAIGNGKVYLGNYASLSSFIRFDIATSTFDYPAASPIYGLGISVDAAGNIYQSDDAGDGSQWYGITKFSPTGAVLWHKPPQPGATGGDQRGAIVDSNQDVWIVNKANAAVSKYKGSDGTPLGVFPVGDQPYTYSDASGQSFLSSNPSGNWTVVHDSGTSGQVWGTISWTDSKPAGTSVNVEVRAANTIPGLSSETFVAVPNGTSFCTAGVDGRYIEIKATLARTGSDSPILYDLTVGGCDGTPPVSDCSFVQTAAHRITTLTATDNCDSSPNIYVTDSDTTPGLLAGPYKSGDKVLIRKNPKQAPFVRSGPAPYKATIQLQGDPLVYATDAAGNSSIPAACHPPIVVARP
jgi:hypothetical protein